MDILTTEKKSLSRMEHTLTTICDWSKPENIAIEYHNLYTIKKISYSDLENMKRSIKSILSIVGSYEFIGINSDVKTYCVPALILGIQAQGCGFVNLPSVDNVKICSILEMRLTFSGSLILDTDLICEINVHGEMVKLLEFKNIKASKNNWIADEFAYGITTSGSTGEPKIAKVPHACIVPNIIDLKNILLLSEADKIAQITTLTFDPSIVEIFLGLSCGGTLFFVSKDIMDDPNILLRLIFEHRVTILQTTPSLWQYRWSDDDIKCTIFSKKSHLKALILGGEPFPKLDIVRSTKHPENQTKIYNIYGITEISCWASINEIDSTCSDRLSTGHERNLGKTLSQTIFQVRNENNDIIRNGEGILYIGSDSRICVIDSELSALPKTPVFRKTGDLVTIDEDNLFYKDRCDRTVKRFGNRLDLTELEAAVMKLKFVKSCLALWDQKRHKLYLCLSTIGAKGIDDTFSHDLGARKELDTQLRRLPSFYQPDSIKYFNDFRLTDSGKICKKTLMKIFQNTEKRCFENNKNVSDNEAAREIFTQIWKNHLKFSSDSRFLENGGNSVIAMQISNELTVALNSEFPELIGLLLKNETLTNCIDYVLKKIQCLWQENDMNDSESSSSNSLLRSNKKIKTDFTCPEKVAEPNTCVWQKCRGYMTGDIGRTDSLQRSPKSKLNIEFTRDLKKCVDASPTVFKYSSGDIYTSIGSHAGVILTKQLNHPDSKTYEINLPDRIEASVLALSEFNGIIGCYDGYVYRLNLKTGKIIWKFKTQDVVKCTAVLSDNHKSIYVGSYDKYLYNISLKDGSEMWKTKGSEGSISATPRTSARCNSVVFGTLDGTCMSLNQISGEIIWKNKFRDPLFSAPGILRNEDVIFCSVSGELVCFNSETGCKIWRYKIDGNVFSHLVVNHNLITNTEDIIIGCNNKSVHCLAVQSNTSAPILRYSVTFESQIFATPYCEGNILAVADTSGNINLLNVYNGKVFSNLKLRGDVFSSPVIAGEFLVVGCRDNNMYVVRIVE